MQLLNFGGQAISINTNGNKKRWKLKNDKGGRVHDGTEVVLLLHVLRENVSHVLGPQSGTAVREVVSAIGGTEADGIL